MKKNLLIIFLVCLMHLVSNAQPPQGPPQGPPPPHKNIQSIKVAFITRELNLTAEEAQKFWPLYNAYSESIKKIRIEQKQDVLGFEEKALAERKKLKAEMKKILVSEDRANIAMKIDRDFNEVLRNELKDRRDNGNGNGRKRKNNPPNNPPNNNKQ
jgi:Spy/CpxP family protein refolding chaperone